MREAIEKFLKVAEKHGQLTYSKYVNSMGDDNAIIVYDVCLHDKFVGGFEHYHSVILNRFEQLMFDSCEEIERDGPHMIYGFPDFEVILSKISDLI